MSVNVSRLGKHCKVLTDFVENKNSSIDLICESIEELQSIEGLSREDLISSKLGALINRIRKCENKVIQAKATELLVKWRPIMLNKAEVEKRKFEEKELDQVESKRRDQNGNKGLGEANQEHGKNKELGKANQEHGKNKKLGKANQEHDKKIDLKDEQMESISGSSDTSQFDIKNFFYGDSTRDKCFEMLVLALMTDQSKTTPDEIIISTAQSIERSLFNEFGCVNPTYKTKFRSKYLNLKDKNNPTLRNALISGMISPERFCGMTTAEMASEDRRKLDEKIAESNLLSAQVAKDTQAETDQFKCSRCQKRRCKYYQMQTRSADEPMTTFVSCLNCGNRWRRTLCPGSRMQQKQKSTDNNNYLIKYFGLDVLQIEALKFGLGSLFLGSTSGLLFGSSFALMRGLDKTGTAKPAIVRSFKNFTLAGFTFGLVGANLIYIRGTDDYWTRMVSGCAAGLSLGIANKSSGMGCFACVSLGGLAVLSKFLDKYSDFESNQQLQSLMKPEYRKERGERTKL